MPSRYLFCPERGFYEFTRIAAPKKTPKSWLITSDKSWSDGSQKEGSGTRKSIELGTGYITKSADLFIATPIDVLFLVLPALVPKGTKETKQHFLCLDDHLDTLSTSSRHLKALLAQHPTLRSMIEKRMTTFCDTVDAGDETMYRISDAKLLSVLVTKAQRMCKQGLPASMEEKFIKPALDIPILNIWTEESTISMISTTTAAEDSQETAIAADSQTSTTTTPSADSQTTTESQSTTATSVVVTEEPSPPPLTTPPEVPHLLRLRTSLNYLLHAYIPPTLQTPLKSLLTSTTSPHFHPSTPSAIPDFTPLDTHLAAISKLKTEAAALRPIADNISRKRYFEEDEEKIAEREEKKRKKEEEENKKKTESRSIKALKKADTSGMKKLSSFFTAAPKKA